MEVLAARGRKSLAFGPLKPVGLTDPRTGERPYAVVQLRQDNQAGTLYNLVGFQTNLKWGEQERVFRLIPGLEEAEFVRFGQMHRNTFINSPALLRPTMQFRGRDDLFFAGQITGTEGYVGSVASGFVAGLNAARLAAGREPLALPPTTMIGALCRYVSHADPGNFQPMKANFGLVPAPRTAGAQKARALRCLRQSRPRGPGAVCRAGGVRSGTSGLTPARAGSQAGASGFQHGPNLVRQRVYVEGFGQEGGALVQHAVMGDHVVVVARHVQHTQVRNLDLQLPGQLFAVHFGHHHVGQQQVDGAVVGAATFSASWPFPAAKTW